jgi:hypothetical protein
MNTKFKDIPEETISEPRNPTSMLDITESQCKYPLGEEKAMAELFCGRERWIDKTGKHHSYCYPCYEITHERKNNT